METELKKKQPHNIEHVPESRYKALGVLSDKILAKYGKAVSSVLLKRPKVSESKELLFIIDDLNNVIFNQQALDIKMFAVELAYSCDMQVTCDVMLASTFWEGFKTHLEDVMQLTRDSLVLYDAGFFLPLQDLLVTGKVRPTKESVSVYFTKAEKSIKSADRHVSRAVLDLYWAVIDTAHAAIMVSGITPPSPKDLAEAVRKELVSRNLVHKRCGDIVQRFYEIAKRIMHKEVWEISGKEFDSYLADADFFIKEMDDFVAEHAKK